MIFLFNNVYLSPDKIINLRPEDDSAFISHTMRGSSYHIDNFFSVVFNTKFKAPVLVASSYDDAIGQLGGEDQLFQLLMQPRSDRLVIMCDEESMLVLLIKCIKTMLPRITGIAGWTLMKYMYLPYYLMYNNDLITFMGPRTFDQIYLGLLSNETDIMKRWSSTPPWTTSKHQRKFVQRTAGVELQTATYLVHPQWEFAPEYKDKIVLFAKKTLLYMLVGDLRRKLLEGFMDIQKVLPDINPLSPTVVADMQAHPVYKFLVDPEFVPGNWEYVFDEYDMSELYSIFQTYAPLRAFNLNDFSLLAKENALTFEDVLQHELQSQGGRNLLGIDPTNRTTVNVYLLDLFFDLFSKDATQLRPYSLV